MAMDGTAESKGQPDRGADERTGVGATATPCDNDLSENPKENLDDKLDNAVDETFPGSDPVSVKITK
jgi:hypothetical protein